MKMSMVITKKNLHKISENTVKSIHSKEIYIEMKLGIVITRPIS